MNGHVSTDRQAREELELLREQVARLEALLQKYRATEEKLAHLADFPEQNPDIVVEADTDGRVNYLNPAAQARFPELRRDGFAHPLLGDLPRILRALRAANLSYHASEIDLRDAVFERQISLSREPDALRVRVYVHDITRRKRAEQAIRRLAKQVVSAQEEERRRISRELHDEAGQALTALKLGLELLRSELPLDTEMLRQNLAEAVALAETTRERVRRLALGLRPPALDTVGLNLTLEACCSDFARRTRLAIDYRGSEPPGLSDAAKICLYRVLQEALTNVARHAGAGRVEVTLFAGEGVARLTVSDDGRGLAPGSGPHEGIGMLGMRERLELLGGRLEVESAAGPGLRLTGVLPLGEAP